MGILQAASGDAGQRTTDRPQRVYVVAQELPNYDEEASWCVVATSPAEAKDVVRRRIGRGQASGIDAHRVSTLNLRARLDRGAGPRVVHTHFLAG